MGTPEATDVLSGDMEERDSFDQQALSLAIEQVGEAVMVTDADGVIRYVNPAFEEMTGYSREEVLGKTPAILKSGVHDLEFYAALWSKLLAGEVWRGEFRNQRKDGSLYREAASISPLRRPNGEPWGYVAVKRNLTRERALEDQLVSAQRIDSIGRLVGGVTHDFNNILTVMLTYLQFVDEDLPADTPMKEDVQVIADAARRAAVLVSQLLAFTNRPTGEPRKVDVNQSVRDLEKMLRRIVGEDVTLAVELGSEPRPVLADPGHIEQVIMNLVVNAREAMPRGGTLTIKTEVLTAPRSPLQGAAVALRVIDTGEGMDQATRQRAVEPFFSTKARTAGAGLGLATVRDIVRRCHGTLVIDSEPGEGTQVSVYLPVAPLASVAPTDAPSSSDEKLHVLVVDDDAPVRAAMRRTLRGAGYQVSEASGGRVALELLSANPRKYALMVSDVVMPGLSGGALRQQVAASYPQVPVLLVSGYHGDALNEHVAVGEGIALLAKPFSVPQLLEAVSSLLE